MQIVAFVWNAKLFFSGTKTLNYNTPPLSCHGQITLSYIDEIFPLAIPNQISLISMHVPSLVKIPSHLQKLSSKNKKMGVSWAENSVKLWRNLTISNLKPDLHNINPLTKLVKVHWCLLTLSSGNKIQTDRRTYETVFVRLSLWSFFALF